MFEWHKDGFPYFKNCLQYIDTQCANKKIDKKIIDSLSEANIAPLRSDKKIVVTNNYIKPTVPADRVVKFDDTWYGIYAGVPNIVNRAPVKKFNCFIKRMDIIRQSWAYQLVRRKLFAQGFISFNMDISRHIMFGHCKPTDSPMDVFENQFITHCAIFAAEHEFLKQIVPYKNFDTDSLSQLIIDSNFSIVLETYHDNNNFITLSEKIFRCLKLPRPWVMHAQQGAVAYVRNMGFDVLDDIVDHSYDDIEFTIDRQVAILNQCEVLANLDITQHEHRLDQAANHNINLLNQFYNQWHDTIDNGITKAIELFK